MLSFTISTVRISILIVISYRNSHIVSYIDIEISGKNTHIVSYRHRDIWQKYRDMIFSPYRAALPGGSRAAGPPAVAHPFPGGEEPARRGPQAQEAPLQHPPTWN